jgi:prepilin signal peptidase PulO-like enzyme (type II secretory pathway)
MEIVLGALLGVILGHLAAICFVRFYTDEEVTSPLYHCASCRSRFRPQFAIPLLGWIAAAGRCPDCAARLPIRWLVLPVGSAAMFVASWFVFDDLFGCLLGGLFGTVFLTLTLTDFDRRLLPNRIVYPSIIIAMALSWAWPDSTVAEIMGGGLVGIAVAAVLLLVSLPFGAGALGMGDVKMIILIGFVVGFPSVLIAIFIGTLAAGLVAGFLVVTRIRGRKDYIPHGPFLALGAVAAMWFGPEIWDAYRN